MQTTTDKVQKEIEVLSVLLDLDYQHRPSPLSKIHDQATKRGYNRRRGSWNAALAALAHLGAVKATTKQTRVVVGSSTITVPVPCWRITADGRRRLDALLSVNEQP